jgi:predicted secreted protein
MRALPLLFLLLLGLARAGDAATLEFWGFSPDGKYLAFEQYGTRDGSGFPYAELYVVEVARNVIVAAANVVIQSDRPGEARRRAFTQSQAALRRYRIAQGNQGRFAGAVGKNHAAQSLEFSAAGATYTLELTTLEAPASRNCLTDPKLLELRLSSGRNARVLQRDSRLPASRACAHDYEIHSVFVLGSSLAVFVRVTRDGFEGWDLRWMVVTAQL